VVVPAVAAAAAALAAEAAKVAALVEEALQEVAVGADEAMTNNH